MSNQGNIKEKKTKLKITNDVIYIGVNDRDIDLFEGQYKVPNGMAYNSYVILDEKVAVMDTVDARFGDEWLSNLKRELGERECDYLIVQHMEPDHSANITLFMKEFPKAKIVSSDKAFVMIKQFFGECYEDRRLVVKSGDTLSLGKHLLTFVAAPMVHWPEVFVTYDSYDKVLFSADAFGKFGALDTDEEWACEARRYYFGIVGKYGMQAKKLLDTAAKLDIKIICSLHGPILKENLGYYIGLYSIWASYEAEDEGIVIAYTSVYGNTRRAVMLLSDELKALGQKVALYDLARCDMSEAVEDAFRYDRLVLATTTYNGEVFPFMRDFLFELVERGYKNRTVGIIDNGSWAPMVKKKILATFEGLKDIRYTENTVTLRSALDETSKAELFAMARELAEVK